MDILCFLVVAVKWPMPLDRGRRTPHVGRRIREYREARGLTQEELAALLGTTNQHVSRLENSIARISVDLLLDVAAVLDCLPADLLQDDERPNIDDLLAAIKGHWEDLQTDAARNVFIKDLKRRFPGI